MSPLVSFLVFFITTAFLVLAGTQHLLHRQAIGRSLKRVQQLGQVDAAPVSVARSQVDARPGVSPLRALGRLGARIAPARLSERLERELTYAGNPSGWDARRVLGVKALGVTGLGGGTLLLCIVAGASMARFLLLTILMAAIGYLVPDIILRSRYRERQGKILKALPDALELLCISVEAGMGFDAALRRLASDDDGPLSEELSRAVREMQLGQSRPDSLRALADRSTIPEFKSFVIALIQADAFGISIGSVLHTQADQMRLKRRQRAEERAQKIPVKITFPLLFCVFPALLVVLLGPAAITVSKTLLHRF